MNISILEILLVLVIANLLHMIVILKEIHTLKDMLNNKPKEQKE